jgi:hypothetical protein
VKLPSKAHVATALLLSMCSLLSIIPPDLLQIAVGIIKKHVCWGLVMIDVARSQV